MADSAAYEIFEVGVQRDKKGKTTTRQFLDACADFTGGVLGQYYLLQYDLIIHIECLKLNISHAGVSSIFVTSLSGKI